MNAEQLLDLLKRYMRMVCEHESTTFVGLMDFEGTPDEVAFVTQLGQEVEREYEESFR